MKQTKSRRSVANQLVNKFINDPRVGIKSIKVSEAGNIAIKCCVYTKTMADIRLRVNLSDLTYVFLFYSASKDSSVKATSTKRKDINCSPHPSNAKFFYDMLSHELEVHNQIMSVSQQEYYMGKWEALRPEPIPDLPDHVRYAAESLSKTHGMSGRAVELDDREREQLQAKRHTEILQTIHSRGVDVTAFKTAAEHQYEQLLRERDNTPLFSDEQYDRWIEGKEQPTTMDGQPVAIGVTHKLTDEEIKYLYDDAQRPYNNKLQELMSTLESDGTVTVSIDQSYADKAMRQAIDMVNKDVCDLVRVEVTKAKKDDK